jgi:D-serine deaminase-like pyridoxal phosphate-dependent protein
MVDHPAQISAVEAIHAHSGIAPDIFLKIDMGGHRAGVVPNSPLCKMLITSLLALHSTGTIHFIGLYSHAGQSYTSSSPASALDYLRQEFEALLLTVTTIQAHPGSQVLSPDLPLLLSVGATPTTTSIRNLLIQDDDDTPVEAANEIAALRGTIRKSIETPKLLFKTHALLDKTLRTITFQSIPRKRIVQGCWY